MTTSCISPPELNDEQLLAYLDDPEADQEVALHLKRCAYCQEKAETLERFQKTLTRQLYRIDCPSSLELGEYHLHMLPAPQMLVISQHVRECPHCAREVAQLEEFFLGDLAPMENSLLGQAKVLIAKLISGKPGESTPAFAALRGESKGPLIFEADDIVITLDVQSNPNGQVSIQGQVAADDQDQWTDAVVRILQADMSELTASLDDLGAFGFEEVYPGLIQLNITSPTGIEVQIQNVDITV